ncbi:glycosyl transferase family 2 [Gemella sp. ND 6198]|uniref:glycosyltransferase family 2 protein n=1 Tax=Gemella sp. ND 6198 TaxID=2040624 RepID=UPI000E0A7EBA|nr:glycosyltransferase family 2 protein [Gemella sp. ND 6198]AXI26460.1 glycosyl transferase family 2 [Gemella sp. ND 6198]
MGDKISVIVPVYNVEQYLERCVDSIINQTYKNLEIILVDDGSTDNSGKLCDELVQKDDRIRVIHKENGGLSSARNRGIEEATSDLIGFIDSDDYIDKDMYELLLNNLKKEEADISMCGHYDVFSGVVENQVTKIQQWKLTKEEAIKMVMEAKILSVTAVNKLYKKILFEDLKFEIGKIAEDAFIMVKLLDKCNIIAATNEKKYYYIHRGNSITTQKFSPKFLNVIEAYEQNYDIIKNNYPNLLNVSITRLNWAYFYVLDRLLVDKDYTDKELENKLINYLKTNRKNILEDKLFTRGRKIGFVFLLIHKNLYKKILKRKTN